MSPQEEQLNKQIEVLPVIKKLQETDETLYAELEKLELGQVGINERLDKGAERMDGIEDELKSLKETLRDGLKEVIVEIKDTKISDLKKDLADRKSSDNSLRNSLIVIGVLTTVSVIGVLLSKLLWPS